MDPLGGGQTPLETAKGATACAWTAAMWCRLALLVLVLALLEFPVLAKDSGEVPAARHGCAADALVRARARAPLAGTGC